MSDGRAVVLRDLSELDSDQPEKPERSGELISASSGLAELELTDGGTTVAAGTPVGIQTSEDIYLGQVENAEPRGNRHRLRVRVDHTLSANDIACIQKVWSQEQAD